MRIQPARSTADDVQLNQIAASSDAWHLATLTETKALAQWRAQVNISIAVIVVVVIIIPTILYSNQHQSQCLGFAARQSTQWRVSGQSELLIYEVYRGEPADG